MHVGAAERGGVVGLVVESVDLCKFYSRVGQVLNADILTIALN